MAAKAKAHRPNGPTKNTTARRGGSYGSSAVVAYAPTDQTIGRSTGSRDCDVQLLPAAIFLASHHWESRRGERGRKKQVYITRSQKTVPVNRDRMGGPASSALMLLALTRRPKMHLRHISASIYMQA
ncbi:hypothetical protein M513_09573 [Trichuris suis]|uniref:Uncharacterized protein n=1 Tax=Trichuris suis TaxID=68888 RepID=A0A085LX52_9BILA|nr:hypothetical protein M513_09573 [Trichuris suis]